MGQICQHEMQESADRIQNHLDVLPFVPHILFRYIQFAFKQLLIC